MDEVAGSLAGIDRVHCNQNHIEKQYKYIGTDFVPSFAFEYNVKVCVIVYGVNVCTLRYTANGIYCIH